MANPRTTASGRGAAPEAMTTAAATTDAASTGRGQRRRRSMGPQANRASVSRGPPSLGCGPSARTIAARPTKAARTTTVLDRRSLKAPVICLGGPSSGGSLAIVGPYRMHPPSASGWRMTLAVALNRRFAESEAKAARSAGTRRAMRRKPSLPIQKRSERAAKIGGNLKVEVRDTAHSFLGFLRVAGIEVGTCRLPGIRTTL